jgi:hypothetical protein
MPSNDNETIKITLDDLAAVEVPASSVAASAVTAPAAGGRSYGTIATDDKGPLAIDEERGSVLLQGWFYLGAAGLVGSLLGWGICEPFFMDGRQAHRWGNIWLIPMVVTLICVGCAISESIVERSARKALIRSALALPLGVVLGFLFDFVAEIIYQIGTGICVQAGVQTTRNPAWWVTRGFAWMVFGAAAGVVYGILGQSSKKALYGALGGVMGAGIGGVLFDPIAMAFHGGGASRAVGFGLVGMAAGAGMGLVESALKDRWLYVTAGPLAGKQFILYKSATVLGSAQQCDIYLFKDANILPQHAVVEISGSRVQIRGAGPVFVNGSPTRLQVLQSGAIVQVGRYAFRYQEKHKK